jgi:hypothetical protein
MGPEVLLSEGYLSCGGQRKNVILLIAGERMS